MATKNIQHQKNEKQQSALAKFKLGFEYDVTWREAIKDVRNRAV